MASCATWICVSLRARYSGRNSMGLCHIFQCVGGAHMFVCDKSDISIDKNSMFKYFSWNKHFPFTAKKERVQEIHLACYFSFASLFGCRLLFFGLFAAVLLLSFFFWSRPILESICTMHRRPSISFSGKSLVVGVGIVPDDIDVFLLHAHRGRHHHHQHDLRLHENLYTPENFCVGASA